jgi:hypothetical protein
LILEGHLLNLLHCRAWLAVYVYATLFYYHWLCLIHDLLICAPRHLPYGLIDQAERVDHLGLTRAHFSNLCLQRVNLLPVLDLGLPECLHRCLLPSQTVLLSLDSALELSDARINLLLLGLPDLRALIFKLLGLILQLLNAVLHGLYVEFQLLLYADVLSDITLELLDELLVDLGARAFLGEGRTLRVLT